MIELGDIIKVKRGSGPIAVATEADVDTARLAEYKTSVFQDYQGSREIAQGEIRQRVRDGLYQIYDNAESAEEAAVTDKDMAWYSYTFDVEATESVYQDVENGREPEALSPDTVLFDTDGQRFVIVEEAGWLSDNLSDDILRFNDGAIESYKTVTQAMKEGVWILMSAKNPRIEGNSKVDVNLEVDGTGKIIK